MIKLEDYLKKNKKTYIIFDFDETVAELLLPWDEWYERITSIMRVHEPGLLEHYRFGEEPIALLENRFIEKMGIKGAALLNEYTREFEIARLKGVRWNEELVNFILREKKKYEIYIWSSNTQESVKKALNERNLASAFRKIVTRDMVRYIKPNPDGFKLIDDGKTSIDRYLFVGDSSNDELAAKALGMDYFKVSF